MHILPNRTIRLFDLIFLLPLSLTSYWLALSLSLSILSNDIIVLQWTKLLWCHWSVSTYSMISWRLLSYCFFFLSCRISLILISSFHLHLQPISLSHLSVFIPSRQDDTLLLLYALRASEELMYGEEAPGLSHKTPQSRVNQFYASNIINLDMKLIEDLPSDSPDPLINSLIYYALISINSTLYYRKDIIATPPVSTTDFDYLKQKIEELSNKCSDPSVQRHVPIVLSKF